MVATSELRPTETSANLDPICLSNPINARKTVFLLACRAPAVNPSPFKIPYQLAYTHRKWAKAAEQGDNDPWAMYRQAALRRFDTLYVDSNARPTELQWQVSVFQKRDSPKI
ncbi:hypothetical protein BaRGS_00001530 [Batillaria attramentaria]|uniref:Uncharacterized protein n=1 Tax=Batillaria attramentaria TaxID=370345 RepID=A0ABD0M797_9CAEN